VRVPKLPVADALDVFVIALLLAAVGLIVVALSTGHTGLAWGSVALSVVAAALILRRWRRSWLQRQDMPEDELVLLLEDESINTELGEQPLHSLSVTESQEAQPGSASADKDAQPGEEDTDAADLLVVYELIDEVLVVDEHPRYHLARCRLPDHTRVDRLPVREARELGFTPCARCRPDTTLARKHRAARAATTGSG
jgi:hypothetical protein